jgi:hypothetical protein
MSRIETLLPLAYRHQRKLWIAAILAFILPFSLYIMCCFIFGSDFLGMKIRSPQAMLEGTAFRPYVYRQFIPLLTHIILILTPDALEQYAAASLSEWLNTPKSFFNTAMSFRHPKGPPAELMEPRLYPFLVIIAINYFFLMAYLYTLWLLAKRLFPQMFTAQFLAPVLGALALPPICGRFAYIYDFPVLFFSAWVTLLMVDRRLPLLCVAVALATLNKETSFYYILLFMLYGYRELPEPVWKRFAAILGAIFLATKIGLAMLYADNAGMFLETHGLYVQILTSLGGYPVYSLIGLITGFMLFGYRWAEQPRILRCWLVMLPALVLAWLIFGNKTEYRVFYEIFPCLTLMASFTLARTVNWQAVPARL